MVRRNDERSFDTSKYVYTSLSARLKEPRILSVPFLPPERDNSLSVLWFRDSAGTNSRMHWRCNGRRTPFVVVVVHRQGIRKAHKNARNERDNWPSK